MAGKDLIRKTRRKPKNDNEWKKLDINNLPPDILIKEYEWRFCDPRESPILEWVEFVGILFPSALQNIIDGYQYEYREFQPKAPTHKEIMTKWWKDGCHFIKPESYTNGDYIMVFWNSANQKDYEPSYRRVSKDWFIGKQSFDIPPE